jgi:hypothetical protein
MPSFQLLQADNVNIIKDLIIRAANITETDLDEYYLLWPELKKKKRCGGKRKPKFITE